MPFGVHPAFLILLMIMLMVLLVAAFAVGWAFRKGWDAGALQPERKSRGGFPGDRLPPN